MSAHQAAVLFGPRGHSLRSLLARPLKATGAICALVAALVMAGLAGGAAAQLASASQVNPTGGLPAAPSGAAAGASRIDPRPGVGPASPVIGSAAWTALWNTASPQAVHAPSAFSDPAAPRPDMPPPEWSKGRYAPAFGPADDRAQDLEAVVVGDGEVLTVDDARYAMTAIVEAGAFEIPYDDTPGFEVDDEILLIVLQGPDIGTFQFNEIIDIEAGELILGDEIVATYDGVANRVMVQKVPHFGEVVVEAGGTITAHAWDGQTGGVAAFRAENMTVKSDAQIDVSGLGFRAGEGPGSGDFEAGGGHGGYGGDFRESRGGVGYGPPRRPLTLGSAGGDAGPDLSEGQNAGAPGGGAVFIGVSGTLLLDGAVRANGVSRSNYFSSDAPGGGAGGSIWVEVGTLGGGGHFSAVGGTAFSSPNLEAGPSYRGAGSGGRISVDFEASAFEGGFPAWGGIPNGSPGTTHLRDAASDTTRLLIDNLNRSGRPALITDPNPTVWNFDQVDLRRNGDLALLDAEDGLNLHGGNMAGDGTGQFHIPSSFSFGEAELRGFGLYVPQGSALTLPTIFTVRGTELDIYGVVDGMADLRLAPDGAQNSRVRLSALGNHEGESTGEFDFGEIVIEGGQLLEVHGNAVSGAGVELDVSDVEIHAGGRLSADGLGYQPGDHAGPGQGLGANGAGHGGFGGAVGGVAYGIALEPTTLGSAAGSASRGAAGGGAIHLLANTLHVDGVLSADGQPGDFFGGGGAGGSLWLDVDELSGSGAIHANGGRAGSVNDAGSGAGGRIAIYSFENAFTGSLQAAAGDDPSSTAKDFGGPGTIYLQDNESGSRRLLIDNLGRDGRAAGLGDPGARLWQFDQVELVRHGDLELLDPNDSILLTSANMAGDGTAQLSFTGEVNYTEAVVRVFGLKPQPGATLRLPGSFSVEGVELTNRGEIAGLRQLVLLGGSLDNRGLLPALDSLELSSGESGPSLARLFAEGSSPGLPQGTYRIGLLRLADGQRLEVHPDLSAEIGVGIMADEIDIAAGAQLTADGLGYRRGVNAGPGAGDPHGGGGHGGHGGGARGGQPYGSVREPLALGSAGGDDDLLPHVYPGQPGGGAIKLDVSGVLTVNGSVSANGVNAAFNQAAGAGGSIWILAGELRGSGSIRANGGNSSGSEEAAGAGGRVAIYSGADLFAGAVQAGPGSAFNLASLGAGPGTIYLEDTASGEGTLLVDGLDRTGRPAAVTDPAPTVWVFDRIELVRGALLELLDPDDEILLSPQIMAGDGSGQFVLNRDFEYVHGQLGGFGFLVPEGLRLTLPADLSVAGGLTTVQGEITPLTSLTLSGDGPPAVWRLAAGGSTAGDPSGTYSIRALNIDAGHAVRLESDPLSASGVTILARHIAVQGHLSADGLGYTPVNNGPGAPTRTQFGAGHGGRGGGDGGGPTYGSQEEPTTLGSASHGTGGGAVRLIVESGLSVLPGGAVSAAGAPPLNRNNGGGAGGSLWITAAQILGEGAIRANGGDVPDPISRTGYGGGGGRVKLEAASVSTALTIEARGGHGLGEGEAGTVLVESVAFPTDLVVTKSGPAQAVPGASIEYILAARNAGVASAENVVLVDELPPQVEYVSDNAPVPVSRAGDQLTWSIGDLLPGQRMAFSVIVRVPADTPIGTDLVNQLSGSTDTSETETGNNTAERTTLLVSGFAFEAQLTPTDQAVSLGAERSYQLELRNTGILPDLYRMDVSGLEDAWFSLSAEEVALEPGASATVLLAVRVEDCLAGGDHPFTLTVTSQGDGQTQTLTANLRLEAVVRFNSRHPAPDATLGSRDVVFSWRTDAPSANRLSLFPVGRPEETQTFESELGIDHSVTVSGLERNTTYEWGLEAESACGSSTAPGQRFTVGNGIVFLQREVSVAIDRDYNQRIAVKVANQDSLPHSLLVEVDHPYDDLIINFIGSGSVDEIITLQPGEIRTVTLVVHAQDALQQNYQIIARLTADEGEPVPIQDTATILVRVLAEADYVIEEVGVDPVSGARTYTVTNRGRPISDFSVQALDPETGELARAYITPDVTHARLDTDETLTFKVVPIYGPEDVSEDAVARLAGSRGLSRPKPAAAIPYELLIEAAGTVQRVIAELTCPEGSQVFPVTRQNVLMRFPSSGGYCTNKPKIFLPFSLPAWLNPGNIIDAFVNAVFTPQSEVRPHDTDVAFNGAPIASLRDQVPNGSFRWDVSPEDFNTGARGPVRQQVQLDTRHPNGGHYIVATGFEVGVALDEVTVYICATSQEEAERIADELFGLQPLPESIDVSIRAPLHLALARPDADGLIDLTAVVDPVAPADLPYFNYYEVQATLEYLDRPDLPPDVLHLFDDGITEASGDLAADDQFFNARWAPKAGGWIRMSVQATAPNGVSDTAFIRFRVEELADLAVTRVWQNEVSLLQQQVRVRAEIANFGFPVLGPIPVEFRYYRTDPATGSPIGVPVHISRLLILDGETFERGQRIEIVDELFAPSDLGIYFVEVIVDPG